MPEKKPSSNTPRPVNRPATGLRPGQDFVVPPKHAANNFPDVGMTLRSYQTTAKAQAPRRPLGSVPPPVIPTQPTAKAAKSQPGRFKRFLRGITLKRTVLGLLLLIFLGGGWLGFKFVYNAHKIFGGSILGVLSTTKLKGEASGRVNILLAGNSADDPGHDGANLTDSIMIMSIDTKNNTAFLLSVPRDLYVAIPDGGHQKINAAYVVGQDDNFSEDGYASGGMGELEQIVSEDFGIPIDYYALIDYSALKNAVDAVGGISVNIQSSDPRGLYDPSIDYATHGPLVKLTNGVHTLTGEQALDLARARGDSYGSYGFNNSDFERTQNQREMLVALKTKATTAGVLTNPAKLSSLSDAVGNNVHTDLTLSEAHRLFDLVKPINGNSIKSLSLSSANGKNLLTNYETSDGESALIPAAGVDDYDDIQAYINQQTSSNPVVQEGANIVLLNGTATSGLASQKRTIVKSKGLTVVSIGDAQTNQTTTTIIDNSGGKMPASLKVLQQLFGANVTNTNPYSGLYTADFIVVIGADQIPATTSTTTSGN